MKNNKFGVSVMFVAKPPFVTETVQSPKIDVLLKRNGAITHLLEYTNYEEAALNFKIWQVYTHDQDIEFLNSTGDDNADFKRSREDADPFMKGSLRFDGCVNLTFPGIEDCMLHFCGPEDDPELGFLMREIYKLGPEMESWLY